MKNLLSFNKKNDFEESDFDESGFGLGWYNIDEELSLGEHTRLGHHRHQRHVERHPSSDRGRARRKMDVRGAARNSRQSSFW